MSLVSIAAAINDQITADMAPTPPPKFDFGAETVFVQGAPPRIIYVPRTERIVGPGQLGGDGIGNPRPLWTRAVEVEVHIWGKDFTATEGLLNTFVRALHAVGWGDGVYKLTGGNWDLGGKSQTTLGIVYVLNMTWFVPITRALDTTVVLGTAPLNPLTVQTS